MTLVVKGETGSLIQILCAGGLVIGLAFGMVTRQNLKLVKRGGHNLPEQLALSLATAYLSFYVSEMGELSDSIVSVIGTICKCRVRPRDIFVPSPDSRQSPLLQVRLH